MPQLETLENFIKAVETEAHDQVIERFYTEDASIQENQTESRVGRSNLVQNEREMLKNAERVISKCIRPFFINGDQVIIHWQFRFEWKNNTISEIEEIAHQTWEGEKIKREQFFYDPKQFKPKPLIKNK